ncbi:S-ribosylhomocysteine lyase LuxS involved in autoinducer biosynthesis, partial [Paraburkholderia sp. GAS448]
TVAKDLDGAAVDFTGTDGERKLIGVADGVVASGSKEAINGGQLFGVSSSVADALGGGSTVNADGTVSAPSYVVGGTTVSNVGDAVANIDNRVTDNTTSIENITNILGDGVVGLVQQDEDTRNITVAKGLDGAAVDFTGTDGERKLIGVADGVVASGSKEAINGGQLFGVSSSVADALGGGSTVNADGTVSAPSYEVGGTTVSNVGDAVTNIDNRVIDNSKNIAINKSEITNIAGDITNITNNLNDGTIGLVQQDESTRNITVARGLDGAAVDFTGTDGERKLIGVADGVVASGSKEAINGGQLFGVSSSVADALGGGSTVNADGTVSAPSYEVGGTTVSNVGDAVTNIDNRVIDNSKNIAINKSEITNIAGDITNITNNLNEGTIGLVQQDESTGNITVAKDLDGAAVDFTGTDGERKLIGVADGV